MWHFRADILFIKLTPSLSVSTKHNIKAQKTGIAILNIRTFKKKKSLKPLVTSQEQHKAVDHIISRLSPGSSNTEAYALAASIQRSGAQTYKAV